MTPKFPFVLSLVLCLAPLVASADGAKATTGSDIDASDLKWNPNLYTGPGKVKVQKYTVEAKLGGYSGSGGAGGANVSLDAKTGVYIHAFGDAEANSGPGYIEPGVSGNLMTLKGSDGGIVRTQIEASGFSIWRGQLVSWHLTPEQNEKIHKAEEARNAAGDASSKAYTARGLAEEQLRQCQNSANDDNKIKCDKEVKAYDDADKAYTAADKAYSVACRKLDELRNVEGTEAGATAEIKIGEATYFYKYSKDTGIKQNGVLLTPLEASFHAAGKLNGINLDICSKIRPIAILIPVADTANAGNVMSEFAACAGIQLGDVITIRDEAGLMMGYATHRYLDGMLDKDGKPSTTSETITKNVTFTNTLSAENPGGLPVGAYWEHRIEGTPNDNGLIKTNTFGVKIAY